MSQTNRHLYLTGYRGSGKTCVGKWLGKKLILPSIDLDDRIESTAVMSISDIFAREGEVGFRNRETVALQQVNKEPACIISLGGGAILRAENREIISNSGFCIWLKADVDTLLTRLEKDFKSNGRRPALTSLSPREEISSLIKARAEFYAQAADVVVDVASKSIPTIGEEIIVLLDARNSIAPRR